MVKVVKNELIENRERRIVRIFFIELYSIVKINY